MSVLSPLDKYRLAVALKPKRSKYGNRKTVVDGITFDSAREARRWSALRVLERAGSISRLRRQVVLPLDVNGHSIARYICDFEYVRDDGERVVEDVKSPITRRNPVYRLKRALVLAIHGVEIVET